jgi:phosphoribosylformylglycinamidine (FGAM) synthase PurS component
LIRLRETLAVRDAAGAASINALGRLKHTKIKRGNSVRVYKGMELRLVRNLSE